MKIKDLKKWVNKLPDSEMNSEILFYSNNYGISAIVQDVIKNRSDLYYSEECDPSELKRKSELIEDGYTKSEIKESYSVEIEKGEYIVRLVGID